MNDIANLWIWFSFSLFLILALGLDTYFLDKKATRSSLSIWVAVGWTLVWIVSAFVFNALLWLYLYHTHHIAMANQVGLAFFTGYLIEKSLSVDNLFAFYMVFKQFNIPLAYQPQIFSYGIWSAVIFRLLLIWLGVTLISQFHWILYVMGISLFFTGVKMLFSVDHQKELTSSFTFKIIGKVLRLTAELHEKYFFIKKNGLLYATPLFLALIFIEISDVVFAFDSIPAIFAITTDPFIVWSSNIFAILGLRALYFLLVKSIDQFHLLKYGIALILTLIGVKMLIEPWLHFSVVFSLMIMMGILLFFIGLSFFVPSKNGG